MLKILLISISLIISATSLQASEITKKYLVKGMTCGGCEGGVRQSLIHLGELKDSQIVKVDHTSPDAKNNIGHVVVKFDSKDYKNAETDCKLIKAIKKNPGYAMYMDSKNTNPCKL